jgi:hypothetical protein
MKSKNTSSSSKLANLLSTLVISALAVALVFSGGVSGASAFQVNPLPQVKTDSRFTDITGNLHSDNIVWAYQHGVTTGSPENSDTYKPVDTVNRGSMATFLRRVVGNPDMEKDAPSFLDINKSIHKENIKWLASEGITTGSPENSNTYKPNDPVNRGAMATFLYRLAGEPEYTAPKTSPFADVPTTHLHYKAICWLKSVELTTGSPENSGTYKPSDVVNRGSMATFLHREYSKVIEAQTVCPKGTHNIGGTCEKDTPAPKTTWTPTYFSQKDPRWGNLLYGGFPFSESGCSPTAVAMALKGFGFDVTPKSMGDVYWEFTGFNKGAAGASALDSKIAVEHMKVHYIPVWTLDDYKHSLEEGDPVVVVVSGTPFTFPPVSHSMISFGLKDGITNIYDPYTNELSGPYTTKSIYDIRSKEAEDDMLGNIFFAIEP